MEPSTNQVPTHLGIILDGNRRFAQRLMLKPWKGHEWGAQKVEKLFEWCRELNIKEITLYCFSSENFNRPKEEFNFLMDIFRKEFGRLPHDKKIHENQVKLNFIGRLWLFPQDLQEKMKEAMELTKDYSRYIVNFAVGYGGRAEVIDATRKIAHKIKEGTLNIDQINEETFSDELYMKDEPQLIIRTGGEQRTSNFLIWQSYYSEWIFLDKLWPEFEKEDLIQCIQEYIQRNRRFGK